MHVGDITWRKRVYLGGGGFACVYRVAPGIVAKIGVIALDAGIPL